MRENTMRTSPQQFQIMVEYMEMYGDLGRQHSAGPQGLANIRNHWEKLSLLLNAENGQLKPKHKWRKVWADFKNNTKRKEDRIRKGKQKGTLTDLEKRVLAIIGTKGQSGPNSENGREGAGSNQPQPEIDNSFFIYVNHEDDDSKNGSEDQETSNDGSCSPASEALEPKSEPKRTGSEDLETSNDGSCSPAPEALEPKSKPKGTGKTPWANEEPRPSRGRRKIPHPLRRPRQSFSTQALVRSEIAWRAYQREAERERNRIRLLRLRSERRWQLLFGRLLTLGTRVLNVLENTANGQSRF